MNPCPRISVKISNVHARIQLSVEQSLVSFTEQEPVSGESIAIRSDFDFFRRSIEEDCEAGSSVPSASTKCRSADHLKAGSDFT